MSCKCQDKKTKADKVCNEPSEESFRQAYNRINKDFVQATAQVNDLKLRLEITEYKAKEYLESLSQKVQTLEEYSSMAVKMMDPYTRNKFLSKYGMPPLSPKIS